MSCHLILEDQRLIHADPSVAHHIDLPASPLAASEARTFLASWLGGVLGPHVLNDVQLLADELVTNGVRQARNGIHLGVISDHHKVLVAVQETGPVEKSHPPASDSTHLDESRLGMSIVASVADDFGWVRQPHVGGLTMWFTVVIPQPRSAEAHPV